MRTGVLANLLAPKGSCDDQFEQMIDRQIVQEATKREPIMEQRISPMSIQNEYPEEIIWPDVTKEPKDALMDMLRKIRGEHVKPFRTICRIHSDDKGFMESIHHDNVTNRQYLTMLTEREEWFDAAIAKLSTR